MGAFAAILGAALLAAPAPAAAPAPTTVGGCAWSHTAAADRVAFASAYHEDITDGLNALTRNAAITRGLVATCLGRSDPPAIWADAVVGGQAIQDAAAAELKRLKNLAPADLDKAWLAAPETARACTRANAARTLGVSSEPCTDTRAPLAFLAPLKIVVAPEDGDAVRQALYYFTAKAQAERAEQLLAKFKTDGVGPAATP